jgi:arylsulfatase A-like enzyme
VIKPFVLFLFIGLAALAHAKPNMIFILVDDLGYADIACYGNTLHETPNVDRLAREGMRFTDAYTACAVCSPTRASIQTGQYPIRFGITDWIAGARKPNTPLKEKFTERMLPLEATTIAEALKQNGYQTAFVGKWHLNDKDHETGFPEDQGYDVNVGGHHKGSPPGGYFAPFNNPKMENKPSDDYLTDRLGDEAVSLIEGYGKDSSRPFFLMLAFYTVHSPVQAKADLTEHYEQKLAKDSSSTWKNPKYAAMVHSMDENVGRVFQALEKQGLADDTIVVFFSDNGGLERNTSNHPLSKGKGYYHEGGVRVPLIIRHPDQIKAGAESGVPVVSNDLFPTLLDLAGLPLMPEAHKDGLSLKPVIDGGTLDRDKLYWHYPHYHGAGETPTSAIRMGGYKFIRHYEDGRRELYNLRKDIGESNNLIAKMPEKAEKLEDALDQWLSQRNAYIPEADPSFDPSKRNRKKSKKK